MHEHEHPAPAPAVVRRAPAKLKRSASLRRNASGRGLAAIGRMRSCDDEPSSLVNQYALWKVLGKGAFCEVFLCTTPAGDDPGGSQ
eukprot:SAG22_NODE_1404_length_4491_cov_3.411885_3_plen_86_part_00